MDEIGNGEETRAEQQHRKKHKGKHDKPKPWDDDPNIDRWKVEKFDPSWNEGGMLEVSSFSTLFPQYRGISISLAAIKDWFFMLLGPHFGWDAIVVDG